MGTECDVCRESKGWSELEETDDGHICTSCISNNEVRDAESQLAEANTEISILRESLAWYRDAQYDPALSDDIHDDKGQRARDTLQGSSGKG